MKMRSHGPRDLLLNLKLKFKESIKAYKQKLAQCQKDIYYLENFTPYQEIPSKVAAETKQVYTDEWIGRRGLDSHELNWVTENFSPFWEKHGAAYLKIQADAEAKKKCISATNRKSAPAGPSKRDKLIWISRKKVSLKPSMPGNNLMTLRLFGRWPNHSQ